MWRRPLEGTVPNGPRTRKDIKMKLVIIFAVVLAISKAEVETNKETFEDSQAEASEDTLLPAASSYSYGQEDPSPPKPWEPSYVPPTQNNYYQTQNKYRPQNNYNTPSNNYNNPTNTYNPPSNTYNPPSNTYNPPSNTYNPPSNTYNPPSNNYNPPSNNYNPPSNTYYPQNNYNKPVQSTWQPSSTSTTTPIPVIKNEQYFGENGSYKYEYEIADGTHVGEEGYFLNPNTENESIVKKGWYSYTGADGKVYTVTYWADDTGFHASGDHLPKAPPIPPAIQASIDQNAKEEAQKAEAEKNKPQTGGYYPQQQQPPKPLQPQPIKPAPTKPQYPQQQYPQQQYPQQQYPQQQYPQQQYPQQQYPQQQYPQQQYPQQQYPQQQYPQQQYPQTSKPVYYPPQPTQTTQSSYPQENYPSSSGYGK